MLLMKHQKFYFLEEVSESLLMLLTLDLEHLDVLAQ